MSGPQPRVSVVIPTYNRARLLPRCLESIRLQTYEDLEVIVIDDGSTDNTADVVSAVAPWARYIHQDNMRIPAARNRGVAEASGQFIKFVDSDDVLAANAIETEVAIMDRHLEVGLVYSSALEADESGRITRVRGPHFAHDSYVRPGLEELKDLLFTCYITCSTVLIRKDLLIELGPFDLALFPFSEDWDMFLRIARASSIAYIDEPLVTYYVHSSDTANSYGGQDPAVFERLRRLPIDRTFADPIARAACAGIRSRVLARHHWTVATRAYKAGDMPFTRSQLRKAFVVAPSEWFARDGVSALALYAKSFVPLQLRTLFRPLTQRLRSITRMTSAYDSTFQSRSS